MARRKRIKDSVYRIRNKRNYRDVFFRELFGENKQALLELFNALNGTAYIDVNNLEVVTIEGAIYISWKNDVAFMVAGIINMYEHQSTINPNLPIRMLIYLGQEYQRLINGDYKDIYGKTLIHIPTPKCVVLYNGEDNMPAETILNLSDAYENKNIEPDADLRVRVININPGFNSELVEKCKTLSGYITIVQKIRELKQQYEIEKAINMALDFCIENNILAEFIRKRRAEVFGSLLTDFDKEKYERNRYEEGFEDGKETGRIFEKQKSIFDLLEDYGPIPEEISLKIQSITDTEELSRLHKLSAKVNSIEEFLEKID